MESERRPAALGAVEAGWAKAGGRVEAPTGNGRLGAPACDLRSFLAAVLAEGPPPRVPPPAPAAVDRVWRPQVDADPSRLRGAVVARHPDLDFALQDVPAMRRASDRPRWSRGRQGRFPSKLMARPLRSHSSLEFDCLRMTELEASTAAYIEQPLRLRYHWGGRWRTHTPDLLVARADGLWIVEVKHEDEAARPENAERWQAIGSTASALGFGYNVQTERHIRRQPRHANVAAVFRARHARPDDAAGTAALAAIERRGSAPAGDLQDEFGLSLNQVWYLVRHCKLAIDLDGGTIGRGTVVSPRSALPWATGRSTRGQA